MAISIDITTENAVRAIENYIQTLERSSKRYANHPGFKLLYNTDIATYRHALGSIQQIPLEKHK